MNALKLAQWVVVGLLAWTASFALAQERVTGTAAYRERIALPPNAVFEAILEEVSRADAPTREIARTRIEGPGQPPIAFDIEYDAAKIDERLRYVVRARILVEERLLFASDTVHLVLTQGAPREVNIMMRKVSQRAQGPDEGGSFVGAHGLRLPATFKGDLPCADCEGIRHHLNLWPDQVFQLRRTYLGKNDSRDEIGRWRVDPERRALLLSGEAEPPLQFEILGPERLRQLDQEGAPILSDLPYELTRSSAVEPLEPRRGLRGGFVYLADAARFTECLTGRNYPVAMEGEYRRLEAAYLKARAVPGVPLVVRFEGHIAERPRMEGEGAEATVVVERFIEVRPDETCESARAQASLTNTYWRIVRLGDAVVTAADGRREPHLLLRVGEPRFVATVGCNQLVGGYEVSGEGLRFSAMASTRMACAPPLDEWEQQLGEVLARTTNWRIEGEALSLGDNEGRVLARLQAVYLR